MEKLFRLEKQITNNNSLTVPKQIIEKGVIMEFLNQIPIDYLKELVSFEEIDFNNKKLWDDARENSRLLEDLYESRRLNATKYSCELKLTIK